MSGNDAQQTQGFGGLNSNSAPFTPTPAPFTPAPFTSAVKKKKKKKFTVDIRNMGVNIDKNEYYEIKLSNSAFPERGL